MSNVTQPYTSNSRNRNISPIIDSIQDYGPALLEENYEGLIPVTPDKAIQAKVTAASSTPLKSAANDSGKLKPAVKSRVKVSILVATALTLSTAIYTMFYLYY